MATEERSGNLFTRLFRRSASKEQLVDQTISPKKPTKQPSNRDLQALAQPSENGSSQTNNGNDSPTKDKKSKIIASLQSLKRSRKGAFGREFWVPDEAASNCYECKVLFSTFKRRHHCRVCGQVFCSKCASNFVPGEPLGLDKPLRTCNYCYKALSTTPEDELIALIECRMIQAPIHHPKANSKNNRNKDNAAPKEKSPRGGSPPNGNVSSNSPNDVTMDDNLSSSSSSIALSSSDITTDFVDVGDVEEKPFDTKDFLEKDAQLMVVLQHAALRSVPAQCIGLYCIISLEKQQLKTTTVQRADPPTNIANNPEMGTVAHYFTWNETYFFDVTLAKAKLNMQIWAKTSEGTGECLGDVSVAVATLTQQQPTSLSLSLAARSRSRAKLTSSSSGAAAPFGKLMVRLQFSNSVKKAAVEDFDLLKVVGKGHFGKVMQVRKRDTGRIYAMKVVRKDTIIANDAVQHILSERNVLRRINHPFIVNLKYSFQTEKKLYLILDYICGGELFTHLSNVECFSEERARFYAAEIVLALGYLHSIDIVYRDLKPENLLLDMSGNLCLTDLGLVKEGLYGSQKTYTFCGSPEYLAPEILLGRGYDKTVDWWALGTFLYEMMTGLPPFFDEDVDKMNYKILHSPLIFDPKVFSPQAQSLIRGLLERDPEKRLGGGPDGTRNIKRHPFFKGIDWQKLYLKQLDPPFKPHLKGINDYRYFDPEFTSEQPADSYAEGHISKTFQKAFEGFSYEAPAERFMNAERMGAVAGSFSRQSTMPTPSATGWRTRLTSTGSPVDSPPIECSPTVLHEESSETPSGEGFPGTVDLSSPSFTSPLGDNTP